MRANTISGEIDCIQTGSLHAVFRWLAAETQGEQASPAEIDSLLPRLPYSAGVSGPNRTIVGRLVTDEKWLGPESFVTIRSAIV
jgi:hypothetical protein